MSARRPMWFALSVAGAIGLFASGRLAKATFGAGELVVFHAPHLMSRKVAPLTANITGRWTGDGPIRYRLGDAPWRILDPVGPRMPHPFFAIELDAADLDEQEENLLVIEAGTRREEVRFRYDPTPPDLPKTVDFAIVQGRDLEAQDGVWETIEVEGEWRVRPVPGSEDYDRLLAVSPAFRGGRRVECDIVLRRATQPDQLFGVGLLPYWGGHPDEPSVRPRRGWSFLVAWYYSKYGAIGMEFSHKHAGEPWKWIQSYRNEVMRPGVVYRVIAECWAERDAEGRVLRHRGRMKFFERGSEDSTTWHELADRPGGELVEDEFCVALVAHRCQAEFGKVTISALPDVIHR